VMVRAGAFAYEVMTVSFEVSLVLMMVSPWVWFGVSRRGSATVSCCR
jgi:hypothetical protein